MEYFSLIPENGDYIGIVKIPESVAEKWAKLPEELDDISKLKVWVNRHFPQEKCIVILFDIWSGSDVGTLEFLIRESHLYSTLKYFYNPQKYAIFKKVFFGDNQFRHSPF